MQVTIKRGTEDLISTGGNHLCGHWLRELSCKHLPENFQHRRSGAISDRDCLLTMTGILCNARTDFNDVDHYKDDRVFSEAFGIKDLPSEPTLRQRLDDLPPERTQAALRKLNLALLSSRTFKTVRAGHLELVPVDIDVSPFDNSGSHKQGVSLTYKKHVGFAPIFAYIGAQGYMLDHELRPGQAIPLSGTRKARRSLLAVAWQALANWV